MNTCLSCVNMLSELNLKVETLAKFNERIVEIHEEPSHRHVLHTDSLRVFDVYFPPNEVSLYHSHKKDSVMICLDGADVTNELPGKDVIPRPPIPCGEIYYRPYATTPLIHRVRNQGTSPFRILDIEVLKESATEIILPPLPISFFTVIENERVRVSKLRLSPLESTNEIKFVSPRLLAITEAGKISILSGDQSQVINADRGELNMEEVAHKEIIKNTGDTVVEIILIEIK